VFTTVELSFREAVFGQRRDLTVARLEPCDRCTGSGAEPGTAPQRCRTCNGTGQVQDVRRSIFGTVMTAHPCTTCQGTGEEILQPCVVCEGRGRIGSETTIPVDIPAGVSDGMDLRIAGGGHTGRAGGPRGDLYLTLSVAEDPVFERRGTDVIAALDVPMVQAALGAEIVVETLDGPETVKIGRRGRGDLFLMLQVVTPDPGSREQRRLLEQLAESRGEPAGKRATVHAPLRRPE
jgi:molecular chaperone DnaJ